MNLLRLCLGAIRDEIWDPAERHKRHLKAVSMEPIPVSMFPTVYANKKASGSLKYEYEVIKDEKTIKQFCQAATTETNLQKNQNQDAIPYEENCVILEAIPLDDSSSYINASWVDGQNETKKYIATQGPNLQTIPDFWRMVWQYNCPCIVMVTGIFEHARQQCERYWPSFTCTFDAFNVTSREAITTAQYTIREFRLCRNDEPGVKRIIRQFQLESWTKNGLPFIGAVVELTAKVHSWREGKDGPIIVHCSDGSGRTGTFICINELLDIIRKDIIGATVPLAQFALRVASSRARMIDNVEQYSFIYAVIAEWVRSGGKTNIKLNQLSEMIEELKKPPTSGYGIRHCQSKYEAQFTLVNRLVKPLTVGECAGGHRIENRRKSRNVLIQPPERARPYLITQEKGECSDYINALYVDGYRKPNQYIVTQWPLVSTVGDFWCLVVDFRVSVIVLLNKFEFGNQKYPIFWPALKEVSEPMKFGPITVDLRDCIEDPRGEMGAFLFAIKKKGAASSSPFISNRQENIDRDLILLHGIDWPIYNDQNKLVDPLIRMAFLAREWNVMTDSSSPILVVSKNGVARVGVFCTISICMDRLLAESEVDVFRAVECVKQNRPQLVENLAEYRLCYTCVLRMAEILSDKLREHEANRNKDPFVIFDELERERTERGYGVETLGLVESPKHAPTDQEVDGVQDNSTVKQTMILQNSDSENISIEEFEMDNIQTLDKRLENTQNLPCSKQIKVSQKKFRRLPIVENKIEANFRRKLPHEIFQKNFGLKDDISALKPQFSSPNANLIYRHRRLPNINDFLKHRRQLPKLDTIIENPCTHFVGTEYPKVECNNYNLIPSKKMKQSRKLLPCLTKVMTLRQEPIEKMMVKCNGKASTKCIAPLNLFRTETETTYLTSSLGEPSHSPSPSNLLPSATRFPLIDSDRLS